MKGLVNKSKRKQVGYVSPEESRKRNAAHEKSILNAIDGHGEVTTAYLISKGFDVSVARRVLVDMHQRGLITLRVSENGGQRTHCYSKAPAKIMRLPWRATDNGQPLGMHRPMG